MSGIRTPRLSGLLKAGFHATLLALASLLIGLFDLFGLESNSDRLSSDIAQYVAEPLYADPDVFTPLARRPGFEPLGQSRISVVYLNDESLERLYPMWRGYPPSYTNQAQLIGDVASGGSDEESGRPRAIFVDFAFLAQGREPQAFTDLRTELSRVTRASAWAGRDACRNDEIVKIACILAAGGVPVILGGVQQDQLDRTMDGQAILQASAVLASLFVEDRAYPLLSQRRSELGSPAALMFVAEKLANSRGCRGPQADPYARLACAADGLVNSSAARPSAPNTARQEADGLRQALHGRFNVEWASRPSPWADRLNMALYGEPSTCARDNPNTGNLLHVAGHLVERITQWRVALFKVGHRQETEVTSRCAYALSLPYGAWYTGPGLSAELKDRLFAGKLVLIGGQFQNSNDWVASPVHGRIPGVQYHAMALDNLVEHDGRPPHPVDEWTELRSNLGSAGLIFLLVLVGGWHRIMRNDRRHEIDTRAQPLAARAAARRFLGLYAGFLMLNLTIIVAATTIAYRQGWPINWVAVATITLGHSLWSVRETFRTDVGPLFDHWPIAVAHRWISKQVSIEDEVLSPAPSAATPKKEDSSWDISS